MPFIQISTTLSVVLIEQMADKLGLINRKILSPKKDQLEKLYVFVPSTHEEKLT